MLEDSARKTDTVYTEEYINLCPWFWGKAYLYTVLECPLAELINQNQTTTSSLLQGQRDLLQVAHKCALDLAHAQYQASFFFFFFN